MIIIISPVEYFANKMVAMVGVFNHCMFCLSASTIHTHLMVMMMMVVEVVERGGGMYDNVWLFQFVVE